MLPIILWKFTILNTRMSFNFSNIVYVTYILTKIYSILRCICVCKLGFTGSRCETNIDDCAGVVCENGGTCVDQVGSYKCQCPLGYDGTQCQFKVVNCDVNPCKNGNCVMMGKK